MTIGRQIGLSIGGMIAACALVGAAGWWCLTSLGERLDTAINVSARQAELVGDLKAQIFTFRLQERGMLLFSYIKADAQVMACRDAFDKAASASLERLGVIRPLVRTDRGKELINQAEAGIQEYKYQQLEVRRILAAGHVAEATEFDKKMLVSIGGKIISTLDQFNRLRSSLDASMNDEAAAMRRTAKAVLLFGLLACALTG